ncbi:alpha/beta-hydrolase [Trametopsis cervina]|nr:alpha/beta-hydrolase [Trametopsis cervina]
MSEARLTTYPPITGFAPVITVPVQSLPLLPTTKPPVPQDFPSLPSQPRVPETAISSRYELTTHLVPAAYTRVTPFIPIPEQPAWSNDRETWKANVEKTAQEVMGPKIEQYEGKLPGGAEGKGNTHVLWNCVNRYTRKGLPPQRGGSTGKPLTLFFSHANGFPKEIWEPVMGHFLAENAASDAPLDIAEMWSWEAVNHGDAALINGGKLGGIYDWSDQSRDIAQFLAHYMPSSPLSPAESLPVHLPRQGESVADSRKKSGFEQRTLVVVAHSFSGAATTIAAVNYPALFSSIVLVDPVLRPLRPGVPVFTWEAHVSLATAAVKRRAHWPSRQEALEQFRANPFWQVWDPAALDRYVECGLYEDPNGGFKLKMSGMQEAIVFAEAFRTYEAWQLCSQMDARIPLKFIMPGKLSEKDLQFRYEMVNLRPANSSHTVVTEAGHLITQEKPKELSEILVGFLREQYVSSTTIGSKL